jgi:hypothetical protein
MGRWRSWVLIGVCFSISHASVVQADDLAKTCTAKPQEPICSADNYRTEMEYGPEVPIPSVIRMGPLPEIKVGVAVDGDKHFMKLDRFAEKVGETGETIEALGEGQIPRVQQRRDARLNGHIDPMQPHSLPKDHSIKESSPHAVGVSFQTDF